MIKLLIKYTGIAGALILGFSPLSFAQQSQTQAPQEEKIVVTTYYPSPHGVYNEFRLSPHATPVTACAHNTQGTIYVTPDSRALVCDGMGNWIPLSGGDYWVLNGTNLYPADLAWVVGHGTDTPALKAEVNGQANTRKGLCIGYDGTNAANCKSDWPVIDCKSQGKCIAGFNMRLTPGSLGYQTCVPCMAIPPPVEPPWPWPPPPDPQLPQPVGKWKLFCTIAGPGQVQNCGPYYVVAGPIICSNANGMRMTWWNSWVSGFPGYVDAPCYEAEVDRYVCFNCSISTTRSTTLCPGGEQVPMLSGQIYKCVRNP